MPKANEQKTSVIVLFYNVKRAITERGGIGLKWKIIGKSLLVLSLHVRHSGKAGQCPGA